MREYLFPLISILSGIILGVIFERVVLRLLKRIAQKTKWEGDEIILHSSGKWIVFWFFLAGVSVGILNLPLKPEALSLIQKGLLTLFILSSTVVMAKISVEFVNLYTSKIKGVLASPTIFVNLTKLVIFAVGMLIILQTLGISIAPILTALGIGGLAVALALQDTLSNLFSGLHILIARQVRQGDYIKLDSGEEGYVADVTWRNTTIKALPNNIIVVPNSKLASSLIINYNLPEKEMAVLVQVGVSYESDLEKVERVTIEVAKEVMREVAGGVPEFDPFIRYHTFNDFSIDFTVILRGKEFVDQYLIKHEFVKRLHKRYNEERIVIPFPIRTIYLHDSEKKE